MTPAIAEDRLILGFKGTISEYELILMHKRLERNRLHKAKRCALFLDVPCGYVKLPTGEVVRDPDEQVQATVQLVFELSSTELGSCRRLYRHLVRNRICLGIRIHRGAAARSVGMAPAHTRHAEPDAPSSDLCGSLFLRASPRRSQADGLPVTASPRCARCRCRSGWCWNGTACRPTSRGNGTRTTCDGWTRTASGPVLLGVPRTGKALLTSLLVCGACGRRMYASYRSKSTAYYGCMRTEERGIDVLRTGSRCRGRSGGPAGFAGPRAGDSGVEPQSDPGCSPRARAVAPPLEATPGAGHV